MRVNSIQKMIRDICEEEGISFHLVSKDWIIVLEKDSKTRFVAGYKFGVNDHALGLVCDDKYAIYDVLSLYHIPVAEHFIVFRNYDFNKVFSYASKYHNNLVVKVNDGTCGNGMYHVTDTNDLFKRIDELLSSSFSISLSPYYEIKTEYRSIIYHDSIEVFYGKKKPSVVGDGIHTIYELLVEFNANYFSKIEKNEKLDKVLPKGEVYEYGWQHNLSKGAMPYYVEDEKLKERVQSLALRTAHQLGLSFASVDIIELQSGELMVLEVNSGVMMNNFSHIMDNGENIAKEIYRKVILDMFEEK